MDARLMLNSKYLKSADFGVSLPAEPILTIARVERATEQGDDGEDETWWVIHFRESGVKPLKTINTNTRCLIACFGNETDDWCGKRVQFYPMPGTWFGERGTAVRIKAADIPKPISVPIKMRGKKGQKNRLVFEIGVLPGAAAATPPPADPLARVWRAWGDAGWSKDSAGFTALVKSVTGKAAKDLTAADVEPVLAAIEQRKTITKEEPF